MRSSRSCSVTESGLQIPLRADGRSLTNGCERALRSATSHISAPPFLQRGRERSCATSRTTDTFRRTTRRAVTTARVLDRGIALLHDNIANPAALIEQLKHVALADAARGPIKIDEYGNRVENVYIRRVEQRNGKLENLVIKKYSNVSQFWEWNPRQYLAHPIYTRSYPACNACTG